MAGRGLGLLSRKDVSAHLVDHLRALGEAAELCEGRVESDALGEARRVVDQADRRLAMSGSATVVALAGATGSGKSSIFNALSGTTLATVGVRRPTTAHAMACSWGEESAEELLDWLQIPRRHALAADPETDAALDGLVLLDLPDHDSTELDHRLEVDRLVQLVDMLIWVVDPQKYADAAIHDRYLKPLAQHADVMMIILNQVDRLSMTQREQCLTDLRRLLDSEGLAKLPVMAVSAATGEGIEALRVTLAQRVSEKQSAARRLAADVCRCRTQAQRRFRYYQADASWSIEHRSVDNPGGHCGRRARGYRGSWQGMAAAGRPGDWMASFGLGCQVQARPVASASSGPVGRRPPAQGDRSFAGWAYVAPGNLWCPEGSGGYGPTSTCRPGCSGSDPWLG